MSRQSPRIFIAWFVPVMMAVICSWPGAVAPAAALPLPRDREVAGTAVRDVVPVHGYHCDRRYGMHDHWHRGYGHTHPTWHRHPGSCYHGQTFRPYKNLPPMFYYPPNHRKWRWRGRKPRQLRR